MSVVGFDVGNNASCVALARKRGIDVLMNKESKRETPTVVHFGEKMRLLGTDGAAKLSMYPKTTVTQIKRLIGKKFQDPAVQTDIQKFPFGVLEGTDGGCLVEVMYGLQKTRLAPEQILAMVLVDLKAIVGAEQGIPVTDCVLSVPSFSTEKERYAVRDAACVAGLNCLRLMNEMSATALAYGIFKADLPENDPIHVAFVDVGHASFQVCIVALKKGQLKVLSNAWDRNLGGRDFDEVLFEHFAAEFQAKHKLDVHTSPKASFRLRTGCEKSKKILSANMEAVCAVECLMEDIDFMSRISRDTFEELSQNLLARVLAPCQEAIEKAGIAVDQITSVEVVGSASRIPAFKSVIEDFFKKPCSRTLNSKECVSRGCALQCAMLSPIFRVRDFEVIDNQPYGICFKWDRDGQLVENALFEKGCAVPCTKLLTFMRSEPFKISADYLEDALLPVSESRTVGVYEVGKFAVPAGAEKAKLKVKIKLNMHGLVEVESVQSFEEEEYEVPEEPEQPKEAPAEGKKDANESGKENGGEGGDAAGNGSTQETAAEAPAEKEVKMVKKKRTKKTDVAFTVQMRGGLVQKKLEEFFESEGKMGAADKLQEETNERKNALESYVYTLRNKMYDELAPFVKEEVRSSLGGTLDAVEDWLYDEGEDQTKSVYVAKLEELLKLGNPIQLRFQEATARPAAIQALNDACSCYVAMAKSDAKEYAHITDEEKGQVIKECESALSWLGEKISLQQQLQKFDEPAVLSHDILKKRDTIDRVCQPIMNKKPPPPPKAETKPEDKKEDKMETDEGNAESKAEKPEAEAAAKQEDMEVDN